MKRAVSAAEANRNFSRVLREVREGRSCIVTAHGKPVARIVPFRNTDVVRLAARRVLFDRLRDQKGVDVGRWTRDDLHDRGQ